jgi:hypothetical protein
MPLEAICAAWTKDPSAFNITHVENHDMPQR